MKVLSWIGLLGASSAAETSTIKMVSPLGSKIKMGGAVLNSYCESDLIPQFVGAYSEAGAVNGGVVNEVTLVLKNVKNTCAGNGANAPCATDAGKDRWPSFVCSFTAADGAVTTSAPVQGLRVDDISAGVIRGTDALVKCDMPARENTDHDVTVSLAYHGKTIIPVIFAGKSGFDTVSISSTAPPATDYPTASPTAAPIAVAVTTGCKEVVDLTKYYRACTSSSERVAQFFSAEHKE
jgi:hypothetical protein